MTREQLQAILAELANIRVVVVGDFCLDRWCAYDPELACPSRETGIPRTAVVAYHVTPGGGGTVANNLAALGAGRVDIVAVAGNDANGFELERALHKRGINTEYLIRDVARQTFTYTKLINKRTGVEDLARVDFVNTAPPGYEAQTAMVNALHQLIRDADVVLVAYQSEIAVGAAITERVRQTLIGAARCFPDKIFVADSRAQVEQYQGLIVKPNEDEAIEAAGRILSAAPRPAGAAGTPATVSPERNLGVAEAGELLRRYLGGGQPQPLYVTRGAEGVLLFGAPNPAGAQAGGPAAEAPRLIPARRNDHPVDICGAGDAFESGLALALAATRRLHGVPDYVAAAQFGHLVSAVTITKPGTGTASPAEVLALFDADTTE